MSLVIWQLIFLLPQFSPQTCNETNLNQDSSIRIVIIPGNKIHKDLVPAASTQAMFPLTKCTIALVDYVKKANWELNFKIQIKRLQKFK